LNIGSKKILLLKGIIIFCSMYAYLQKHAKW